MLIFLGRRHLHLRLHLPPRNLPSHTPRTQSRQAPKRDRQREPSVQVEISAYSSSTLQALHCAAHEVIGLFAHCPGVVDVYGCRLWISIPAVYHYYGSL